MSPNCGDCVVFDADNMFRYDGTRWVSIDELDNEPPVSIQSTLQAETDVFLRGA